MTYRRLPIFLIFKITALCNFLTQSFTISKLLDFKKLQASFSKLSCSHFQKQLVFFLSLFLFFNQFVFAQNDRNITNTNNIKLLKLNDTSFLFQQDTIYELWLQDKSLDTWKINESTEIYTYDNSNLRAWKQANNLSLWFYAKSVDDWQVYNNTQVNKIQINDTLNYINVDDTTVLLNVNTKKILCYKNKEVFLWDNKAKHKEYTLNDTIQFQVVNDTVSFWKYADSTILWSLNTKLRYWQVTKSTKVWTIDMLTELWKAGSNYKLWRRETPTDEWEKDTATISKPLDSLNKQYWVINKNTFIFTDNDSTQIWRANAKKPIWNYRDSIYLWKIVLPKIDTTSQDTIVEKPLREVDKAELVELDKTIKLWNISDSIRYYTSANGAEIWHSNKRAKLWKLNDSTLIWNLDKSTKLSIISDDITLWRRNDTSYIWEIDSSKVHPTQVNKDFTILRIDEHTKFTKIKDSTNIWQVNKNTQLSSLKSVNNYLTINDTIEIWEPNDSTKLWINIYEGKGDIWTQNKHVNILNINDSTKIWQLNNNTRLSITDDQLKVWEQGIGDPYLSWKESKGFQKDIIKDSIRVWYINKSTIIWETKHKIQIWTENKTQELYRLNDTSLVWTYKVAPSPPQTKKISYWKFSGSVKIDAAQMWAEDWAKGAQNNLTSLFIVSLQANYKKKKIDWTSGIEYHYGFIKPGEEQLRKNEDKIKVSSIFNYFAIKKLYYSFSITTQTQFFEGYKHKKDTSYLVSDWSAPLYNTVAVGLNYVPVKQLSVFFSPLTRRIIYVKDTSLINQEYYGIEKNKKIKKEAGIILKSQLNWDITQNINVNSSLDIFSSYYDIKTQNIEWETSFTFKFNNYVSTRLNTHLIYDPNIHIKDEEGKSFIPLQFKELLSIGVFYKI